MGQQHPERHHRFARQLAPNGGMAVEIDIVQQRRGEFGPFGLLACFRPLLPLRFVARNIAFVDGDVAAMADGDRPGAR